MIKRFVKTSKSLQVHFDVQGRKYDTDSLEHDTETGETWGVTKTGRSILNFDGWDRMVDVAKRAGYEEVDPDLRMDTGL